MSTSRYNSPAEMARDLIWRREHYPESIADILAEEAEILSDRQQYWSFVHSVADEIAEEIRDGDCDPDDYHERVRIAVGDNHWTIYYGAAMRALTYTDNENAYEDAFGDEIPGTGILAKICTVVYFAMEADVHDYFRREYGDPDDLVPDDDDTDDDDEGEE